MIDSYPRYERYKDSGVDWLGEIPEEWLVYNSKWLFACRKEKARKNDKQLTASQKYGVIPQNLFMDLESRKVTTVFLNHEILKHVEKGDFVISMRSFQGGIEYCDYQGSVSSAYVPLIPNSTIYAPFYKFLLKSKKYIEALQVTSNLVRDGQALRYDNFCMVPLPLIPFKEQVAIANFLNEKTTQIDQAIALKQQQIAKLEEYKQIVIQNAVTKGLNPDAPMKDSGVDWIGDIPEHWEVKKLKYLGKISSGYSVINSDLKDSGLYEAFGGNGFIGYYNKYNTEGQSIIVGRVGALCGNIRFINDKKWISDNALILKLNNSLLYEHIALVLKAADLNKLNTSNAQPLITGTKVMNVEIPKPTMNEIDLIDSYIKNFLLLHQNTLSNYKAQIDRLKEYKTILINQAVTGKIKIS